MEIEKEVQRVFYVGWYEDEFVELMSVHIVFADAFHTRISFCFSCLEIGATCKSYLQLLKILDSSVDGNEFHVFLLGLTLSLRFYRESYFGDGNTVLRWPFLQYRHLITYQLIFVQLCSLFRWRVSKRGPPTAVLLILFRIMDSGII